MFSLHRLFPTLCPIFLMWLVHPLFLIIRFFFFKKKKTPYLVSCKHDSKQHSSGVVFFHCFSIPGEELCCPCSAEVLRPVAAFQVAWGFCHIPLVLEYLTLRNRFSSNNHNVSSRISCISFTWSLTLWMKIYGVDICAFYHSKLDDMYMCHNSFWLRVFPEELQYHCSVRFISLLNYQVSKPNFPASIIMCSILLTSQFLIILTIKWG